MNSVIVSISNKKDKKSYHKTIGGSNYVENRTSV